MTRTLPPNPSLEQLKKQAKDLRKGHQSASTEAAERIKVYLPRLAEISPDEILQGDFSLQEAQHVVACEYGCKHWEMLCSVVAADLNVLAGLSDAHIQELLRQIDQEDCTRALNGVGSIFGWRIMSNMSLRVRTFISEAIKRVDFDLLDRLFKLSDIQTLLRMVDQKDLVTAQGGGRTGLRAFFAQYVGAGARFYRVGDRAVAGRAGL